LTRRAALIVLDGLGIGSAADSAAYGDAGSNTLGNTLRAVGGLPLPHLEALGLGCCGELAGVPPAANPRAAWGTCQPKSAGKDSTTGHWELCGLVLPEPFPTFPAGFPADVVVEFARRTGRGVLGNRAASGTAILDELGEEHVRSGEWIVYTSADSVFQVAAHEEVIPVAELYEICATARAQLDGEHRVARVIARPFVGSGPDGFRRTAGRRDYALPPPRPTALDLLVEAGLRTFGVGKIHDIFAGRGLTGWVKSADNADGIDQTLAAMHDRAGELIFTNLVDFDTDYGHRRDVAGYAAALEAFDAALPRLLGALGPRDCLVLTADHGTDPGFRGTDHTRERVPLLVCSRHPAQDLGTRKSYADLGQTVLDNFGLRAEAGTSFLESVTA
jgi:phosphopentomutase